MYSPHKSHVSDMDDAQIKISVVIAGRSFPMKITEEEETSVRSIEKDINSQVTEFQQKYTDKDKLDLVIMVLLTKAFELDKIQSLEDDITQAHAQIDTLESTLDQLM
ncbi:MAG TPA: cell division protein ZapA [Saprospirales bacterium]|jgi:cell division protein ZapA (FtsZ GTPase activity inhibitor)|nr:cell division protein ZapA [Saprospirales bacterium]HAW04372.1 cell division protein ZapA [Saprospirales bacterium]